MGTEHNQQAARADMAQYGFIVLCGGKSSRMGRDKADLPYAGGTFLTHLLGKARALGFGEALVSGYRGADAALRAAAVPDVYPERGPLGGLHACLAATGKAACFVCSVDAPLLEDALVVQAAQLYGAGGAQAVLVRHGGRVEPLIGMYDAAVAGMIEPLIEVGSAPVMRLVDRLQCAYLDISGNSASLCNINTQGDYDALGTNRSHIEQY